MFDYRKPMTPGYVLIRLSRYNSLWDLNLIRISRHESPIWDNCTRTDPVRCALLRRGMILILIPLILSRNPFTIKIKDYHDFNDDLAKTIYLNDHTDTSQLNATQRG